MLTRVTLATVPAYKLREHTQVLPFDDCLDGFLSEETSRRNAEFWWLPAHDRCVLKTFTETEEEPVSGRSARSPPRHDRAVPQTGRGRLELAHLPLDEDLPLRRDGVHPAAGRGSGGDARSTPDHADTPSGCTWAVEYRTQPGEQSLLNPTRGMESVTISLHQAIDLPYEPLFRDGEAGLPCSQWPPSLGQTPFSELGRDCQPLPGAPGVPGNPRRAGPGESLYERLSGAAGIGGRYVWPLKMTGSPLRDEVSGHGLFIPGDAAAGRVAGVA